MPKITSERLATKNIIKFAQKEYREKHPLTVQVARVKSETILFKGFLPSTKLIKHKISDYIVISEYQDEYRIYSFNKNANLLGAEIVVKTEKVQKQIRNATSKIYSLPKK